jgi:hypothetical protein
MTPLTAIAAAAVPMLTTAAPALPVTARRRRTQS